MELKDIITKLQKPETLNEGLADLAEYDKENGARLTEANTKIQELEKSNKEYQETNSKLYLRVVKPAVEVETKEEEKKDDFETLLKQFKEEVKNGK